jgi:hypothetical protein
MGKCFNLKEREEGGQIIGRVSKRDGRAIREKAGEKIRHKNDERKKEIIFAVIFEGL